MAQRILVTGGNGQLGSELRELRELRKSMETGVANVPGEARETNEPKESGEPVESMQAWVPMESSETAKPGSESPDQWSFVDIDDVDLTSTQQALQFLEEQSPDWIINCAAYTAVDKAEEEPGTAEMVNAGIPALLAEYGGRSGCRIIHISTDYVFAGDLTRPLKEDDSPSPLSAYGRSKANGETAVLAHDRSMVIRTSWLYSTYGHNFVKSMIRLMNERDELRIVYDQVGTPTYAEDLAVAILRIIDAGTETFVPGIFHYSNEGIASWYDFAVSIREISGADCRILPIETKDYPLPARRPAVAVLNKEKIRQTYQLDIPYWRTSLSRCMEKLKHS